MAWASNHNFAVMTKDLDLATILATTGLQSPSVVQFRTQDVIPGHLDDFVLQMLDQYEDELATGAIISVDTERARVRILPFEAGS